jgi:hypothetical protein
VAAVPSGPIWTPPPTIPIKKKRETALVPNMATSLQKTLAAEAYLANGEFLLQGQTRKTLCYTEEDMKGQQIPKDDNF